MTRTCHPEYFCAWPGSHMELKTILLIYWLYFQQKVLEELQMETLSLWTPFFCLERDTSEVLEFHQLHTSRGALSLSENWLIPGEETRTWTSHTFFHRPQLYADSPKWISFVSFPCEVWLWYNIYFKAKSNCKTNNSENF